MRRKSLYVSRYPACRGKLTADPIVEPAILAIFDLLAPAHDHPQRAETLAGRFEKARLEDIHVSRPGHIVGRGKEPKQSQEPSLMQRTGI